MSHRPSNRRKLVFSGAAALVIALYLVVVVLGWRLRPLVYELPMEYRGWVLVQYADPTCPPIEMRWITLVIRVSTDGRACTSDFFPYGFRVTRYQYIHPDGTRTELREDVPDDEVWARALTPELHREVFFVGTRAQLDQSWNTRPRQ